MNAQAGRMRRVMSSSTATVYLVLIGIVIVSVILSATVGRSFFTSGNIEYLLTSTTVLGFVAIGQTLVILVGSLDLSVPYIVGLSSVLAAGVMAGSSQNLIAGLLTALVAAACIGAVSGVLVGVVKINGFIATLGVGLMVSGYLFTNYRGNTGQASPGLAALGSISLGPVPVTTLIMFAVLLITLLLVGRTRIGMHMYAVGGDAAVARMSGIRGWMPVFVAHTLSGLFSGLAGLVIVARLGVGSPAAGTQAGYDLLSIAAVVLGGAALSGGKGSLWGSLGGILIFACIDTMMGILQVNPYLKDVVRGVIIIIAVAVYARQAMPRVAARFSPGGGRAVESAPEQIGEDAR